MPFGTTPSRWRVYQFHHQGKNLSPHSQFAKPNSFSKHKHGADGLEPATSRVTVECSNKLSYGPHF